MLKNNIDGVLLLNKHHGLSSNAVLQKVKYAYNAKKAGHTGTLDPLATGLLPICFGEATKFSTFLLNANKEYIACIKLGESTTTYDVMGDVVTKKSVNCSQSQIYQVVASFLGKIWQIPPIYSALKVDGKRLYEYARAGEDVAIKSRQVDIFELEILDFIDSDTFKLRVLCSKGTYIRTLAHDIGQKLDCGAHLIGLIRSKTSGFSLNNELTLDNICGLSENERQALLLPVEILVKDLPRVSIDELQFAKVKNGHAFALNHNTFNPRDLYPQSAIPCYFRDSMDPPQLQAKINLYFVNRFLGVAEVMIVGSQVMLKPVRLMRLEYGKIPAINI